MERKIGLPGSITTLANYIKCLKRFYGLYRPLEVSLALFDDWPIFGITLPDCSQARRLSCDLDALGVRRPSDAPPSSVPALLDFAHALGALYVIEGSTLGAQFILPRLAEVLGQKIAGADAFFRGYGEHTRTNWTQFRSLLDQYGEIHPANSSSVIEGANLTFQAIGNWMQI